MNKIQYIKLLEIRGITKLEDKTTIGDAVKMSGGEPTIEEMKIVNELAMQYFIDELNKEIEKNEKLKKENSDLKYNIRILSNREKWLNCLEYAGVDNWEGYSIAQEIYYKNDERYFNKRKCKSK